MQKLKDHNSSLRSKEHGRTILLDICRLKDESNFWDFGGQQEYHLYHQLFLTPGVIYVLVVNLYKFSKTPSGSNYHHHHDYYHHHTNQIDQCIDTFIILHIHRKWFFVIILVSNNNDKK